MHPSYLRRPAFLLLASWLGFLFLLRAWGVFAGAPEGDVSRLAPADGAFAGVVADHPRARRGALEFTLDVERAGEAPARGSVLVRAPAGAPARWGRRLRVEGTLRRPPAAPLPGDGGWSGYLAGRGVHALLEARSAAVVDAEGAWKRRLSDAREAVLTAYDARLSPRNAAVLGGLVLGEKSGLDRETLAAFREAGAVHLLVASGSNVALVLLLAAGLARLAGARRPVALGAGLAAASAYLLIAGPDAPLVRGFLMTAAGLAGFLAGRNPGAFQGLVLAALLMSALDPKGVFQAGFQLSFAASMGLVAGLAAWRAPEGWPRAARYAAGVFLASAAAQLAVWPVLAAHFHRVSAVALVSNVALVPASGVLLAGGLLLAALDAAGLGPLAAVAGAVLGRALDLFCGAVESFAALPGLEAAVPPPSVWTLAAYAGALAAVWSLPDRRRAGRALAGAGLLLVLGAAARWAAPPKLELWACRTQAGRSAAFVRLPSGGVALVGAPPPGAERAALGLGARRVEAVALSCLERPCWSGLAELAGFIPIGEVWAPPGAAADAAELRSVLEARGTRWREARIGSEFSAGGATFTPAWRGGRQTWTVAWGEFSAEAEGLGGVRVAGCGTFLPGPDSGPIGASSDGRTTRCRT